jgi:hypothetical protein
VKGSAQRSTPLRRLLGALALGVAFLPGAARGDTPCAADIEKFCAKVPIGGGRIQACLKEHEKELSPDCAARLDDFEKRVGALAAACRYDIARYCSDVSPGRGRVAECLERHASDVSPTCMDQLRKAEQPVTK